MVMTENELDALLYATMPFVVDKEIECFMNSRPRTVEVSDRFKNPNEINYFREQVGGTWIPHPKWTNPLCEYGA
jgi:hypothetical protein